MIKEINSVKFVYKGKVELDEIEKNRIQEYWEKIKQEKNFLHEAKILIVSNFINSENDFTLELKETTFSNHMYAQKQKDGDIRCLFSGAYIVTRDEYVVCVMNHYYENELEFETLNLVGGMSDAKDIIDGKYSSEKCLKREIKEELGFDIEDNNWRVKLKYLKYPSEDENPVGYPIGTIYEIKTSYTKEQIKEMFKEAVHDNEVKELVFFSKDNYEDISKYEHKKKYMSELWKKIFEG